MVDNTNNKNGGTLQNDLANDARVASLFITNRQV
jgi:hypothetical protein